MAKISAKKSDLKTIANKIIVSPSTAAVSDLKFKRKKDFSTFVKWIESSNKALAGIKLPKKKEVEKLGKGSGGGDGLLNMLFGGLLLAGTALAAGAGLKAGLDSKPGEEKTGLGKTIESGVDNTGYIPKKLKIPNLTQTKVKSGNVPKTKVKSGNVPKTKVKGSNLPKTKNIKSNTLKNLNKGVKPDVKINNKITSSKIGKAPPIPKKITTTNKIVQNVSKPFKNIKLNKGLVGFGRGVLNTVGKGFAVAGGVMSTVDRLQEGQTAKQAFVGATGETVGAWYGFGAGMKLGSAVTAKAASPLLFAPFPGARPLYLFAVLAGGVAGGMAASKLGKSMGGGIADRITGALKKIDSNEKKKTVKEKKIEGRKKGGGVTTVPFPVITNEKKETEIIPIPIGNGNGGGSSSSSSTTLPSGDGVNSTLGDLLLTRL